MFLKLKNKILSKIKDPQDIYTTIYPLYLICNILGLAPYVVKENPSGKREFYFGWRSILKSVLIVTSFLIVFGYAISRLDNPFQNSVDIKYKIRFFQEIFGNLLSGCEIVIGIFYASKIIEVFQNIDEVDNLFRGLAVWVCYK